MNTSTADRRTVAKKEAWSIPAITIGAAAPAVATSCDEANAPISKTLDAYISYNHPKDLGVAYNTTYNIAANSGGEGPTTATVLDLPAGTTVNFRFSIISTNSNQTYASISLVDPSVATEQNSSDSIAPVMQRDGVTPTDTYRATQTRQYVLNRVIPAGQTLTVVVGDVDNSSGSIIRSSVRASLLDGTYTTFDSTSCQKTVTNVHSTGGHGGSYGN